MEGLSLDTTVYSLAGDTPQPDDRRDGERHLTLFRVGAMTIAGRRELCLIKNISAGGMKVRPYCELAEGERLTIELKTGMTVPGSVAWVREGNAGVSFDEPVDVVEILSASAEGPRPRMPRIEVDCGATIRDGSTVHKVRLCDVSQGGAKVEVGQALPRGCDVVLTLQGLEPQHGIVCWSMDGIAGVTFNRLLPLAQLVDWLRELRAEARAA